jgi:hypothetical protein
LAHADSYHAAGVPQAGQFSCPAQGNSVVDPRAEMRYVVVVRQQHALTLLLAACQPSPATHTSFSGGTDLTTAASTGAGSTSGGSSGTTAGLESGSGGDSAESMAEPVRDLGGMPDFGDGSPVGCRGKIDLLFVISRQANMQYRQAQLAAAFPQFIETIKSKFADFDYHIMVVTGDNGWGNKHCTKLCATPGCSVGEPCCYCNDPDQQGAPCCRTRLPVPAARPGDGVRPDVGGGRGVPGGVSGEANKPCPIDGGRRYLVKGQSNLEETFECIATVGASGWTSLGQALVAAVQDGDPMHNKLGSCNPGFLRDDAHLDGDLHRHQRGLWIRRVHRRRGPRP